MSNEHPYSAVVFDMDGVLADSEPVYLLAANEVLARLGKHMTDEDHARIMGHGVEDTWQTLKRELALPGPIEDYICEYDAVLCRRLARLRRPLPGAKPLIRGLRRNEVPLAVASSSLPGWIDALLGGIGLIDSFDALVSASMVERPKPAPDLYLLAAKELGQDPASCIAIEDTPTGVRAAKDAGMFAVQVRSASTAFPPLPQADVVIDSLRDFDLGLLGLGNGSRRAAKRS